MYYRGKHKAVRQRARFRCWKSGKKWLYAATSLMLLTGVGQLTNCGALGSFFSHVKADALNDFKTAKKIYDKLLESYRQSQDAYNSSSKKFGESKRASKREQNTYEGVAQRYKDKLLAYDKAKQAYENTLKSYQAHKAHYQTSKSNFAQIASDYRQALQTYKAGPKRQKDFSNIKKDYKTAQDERNVTNQEFEQLQADFPKLEKTYHDLEQHYHQIKTDYQDWHKAYDHITESLQGEKQSYQAAQKAQQQAMADFDKAKQQYANASNSRKALQDESDQINHINQTETQLYQKTKQAHAQLAQLVSQINNEEETYNKLADTVAKETSISQQEQALQKIISSSESFKKGVLGSDFSRAVADYQSALDAYNKYVADHKLLLTNPTTQALAKTLEAYKASAKNFSSHIADYISNSRNLIEQNKNNIVQLTNFKNKAQALKSANDGLIATKDELERALREQKRQVSRNDFNSEREVSSNRNRAQRSQANITRLLADYRKNYEDYLTALDSYNQLIGTIPPESFAKEKPAVIKTVTREAFTANYKEIEAASKQNMKVLESNAETFNMKKDFQALDQARLRYSAILADFNDGLQVISQLAYMDGKFERASEGYSEAELQDIKGKWEAKLQSLNGKLENLTKAQAEYQQVLNSSPLRAKISLPQQATSDDRGHATDVSKDAQANLARLKQYEQVWEKKYRSAINKQALYKEIKKKRADLLDFVKEKQELFFGDSTDILRGSPRLTINYGNFDEDLREIAEEVKDYGGIKAVYDKTASSSWEAWSWSNFLKYLKYGARDLMSFYNEMNPTYRELCLKYAEGMTQVVQEFSDCLKNYNQAVSKYNDYNVPGDSAIVPLSVSSPDSPLYPLYHFAYSWSSTNPDSWTKQWLEMCDKNNAPLRKVWNPSPEFLDENWIPEKGNGHYNDSSLELATKILVENGDELLKTLVPDTITAKDRAASAAAEKEIKLPDLPAMIQGLPKAEIKSDEATRLDFSRSWQEGSAPQALAGQAPDSDKYQAATKQLKSPEKLSKIRENSPLEAQKLPLPSIETLTTLPNQPEKLPDLNLPVIKPERTPSKEEQRAQAETERPQTLEAPEMKIPQPPKEVTVPKLATLPKFEVKVPVLNLPTAPTIPQLTLPEAPDVPVLANQEVELPTFPACPVFKAVGELSAPSLDVLNAAGNSIKNQRTKAGTDWIWQIKQRIEGKSTEYSDFQSFLQAANTWKAQVKEIVENYRTKLAEALESYEQDDDLMNQYLLEYYTYNQTFDQVLADYEAAWQQYLKDYATYKQNYETCVANYQTAYQAYDQAYHSYFANYQNLIAQYEKAWANYLKEDASYQTAWQDYHSEYRAALINGLDRDKHPETAVKKQAKKESYDKAKDEKPAEEIAAIRPLAEKIQVQKIPMEELERIDQPYDALVLPKMPDTAIEHYLYSSEEIVDVFDTSVVLLENHPKVLVKDKQGKLVEGRDYLLKTKKLDASHIQLSIVFTQSFIQSDRFYDNTFVVLIPTKAKYKASGMVNSAYSLTTGPKGQAKQVTNPVSVTSFLPEKKRANLPEAGDRPDKLAAIGSAFTLLAGWLVVSKRYKGKHEIR